MKIYMAAVEPISNIRLVKNALFSFYDIYVSTIPFRKITFNYIKDEYKQKQAERSSGNSKTGIS